LKDKHTHPQEFSGYMTGQLLLATPQMQDVRFERAVMYVCGHDQNGAMGLIVNKYIQELTFKELIQQLGLPGDGIQFDHPVHFGGPVDNGRGFVLHTDDYVHPTTVHLFDNLAMTATLDILQSIAEGEGPDESLVAMGYTGWGPGQLEQEISNNMWLQMDPDFALIFSTPIEHKWELGMQKIGIDVATLDPHAGQA
jgi:putative transcriptional regulator